MEQYQNEQGTTNLGSHRPLLPPLRCSPGNSSSEVENCTQQLQYPNIVASGAFFLAFFAVK